MSTRPEGGTGPDGGVTRADDDVTGAPGTGGRGGVAEAVPLSDPAGGMATDGGVEDAVPLSDPAGGIPTDGGVDEAMPLVEPAGGIGPAGGAVFVRTELALGNVSGSRPGTVNSCCMMFTHGTPGLTVPGSAIAVAGLNS